MNGHDIKITLGKNIKFLRFRREYSQADLAEDLAKNINSALQNVFKQYLR